MTIAEFFRKRTRLIVQQSQHQWVFPESSVVGFDATDDGKNDSDDAEHHEHGDADQEERQKCGDDTVNEHAEQEVQDFLAVRVDFRKFLLLQLPDQNGGNESGEGDDISCKNREVDKHGPVATAHSSNTSVIGIEFEIGNGLDRLRIGKTVDFTVRGDRGGKVSGVIVGDENQSFLYPWGFERGAGVLVELVTKRGISEVESGE